MIFSENRASTFLGHALIGLGAAREISTQDAFVLYAAAVAIPALLFMSG
jgi:hypothetical protein